MRSLLILIPLVALSLAQVSKHNPDSHSSSGHKGTRIARSDGLLSQEDRKMEGGSSRQRRGSGYGVVGAQWARVNLADVGEKEIPRYIRGLRDQPIYAVPLNKQEEVRKHQEKL